MKMPFEPGDQVTTPFYPIHKKHPRTVIRCYRSIDCPSGWLVDTVDTHGKPLNALDSKWYQLARASEELNDNQQFTPA
ncbi:hypothetical protein [Endozoicomonas ascidiicola]|uniref:hypothetical protein n=1 Tax=Endozoicomonas ascidiicola TaxID=1698521 RepID=UPI00083246EB|nr:hypothetical protein [Endozoicomonas ascidiicola]